MCSRPACGPQLEAPDCAVGMGIGPPLLDILAPWRREKEEGGEVEGNRSLRDLETHVRFRKPTSGTV